MPRGPPTPVNARRAVVLVPDSPPATLAKPPGAMPPASGAATPVLRSPPLSPRTPTSPMEDDVFRPTGEIDPMEQLAQLELLQRLAQTPKLDIVRTPDVPLGPKASKQEVTEWLKIKGLQPASVKLLSALEAGTLLTLQKGDLSKLLHNAEDPRTISRIHSQLQKQRAINKFTTIGSAEFKAALARRRQKVDEALDEAEEARNDSATAC